MDRKEEYPGLTYISDEQTTPPRKDKETDEWIDLKKYADGKPKRITIRAKVIHDGQNES